MTQPVTTSVSADASGGTLNDRAAAQIRALMAARRKTSAELGDVLGISQSSASRRMLGEGTFTLNQLETTARWLGVPIADIVSPAPGIYNYAHAASEPPT
jgi:transcriptional regulator with XRE-family HTH domain